MSVTCSPENPCTAVQLITKELVDQREDVNDIKKDIKALQTRLPLWATMAFAACGTIIGFLVK